MNSKETLCPSLLELQFRFGNMMKYIARKSIWRNSVPIDNSHKKVSPMTKTAAPTTVLKRQILISVLCMLSLSEAAKISTFVLDDPFHNPNRTKPSPPTTTIRTSTEIRVRSSNKAESTSTMRAWTCHGKTQREMVENLISVSGIY